jgi:hypothetical protein
MKNNEVQNVRLVKGADGRMCLVLDEMLIYADSLAAVLREGDNTVFEFRNRDFTSYVACDYEQVVRLLAGV